MLFLDEARRLACGATHAYIRARVWLIDLGVGVRGARTTVSMVDVDIWNAITGVLSLADHARRVSEGRGHERRDAFGDVHVILFGDFKRVP